MSGPILLVDEDTDLNRLIHDFLNSNGFNVHVETHGDCVVDSIFCLRPVLVILDIMLPGLDGLSVCRSVRASFNGPILILTELADDIDQVAGLEIGADAYLIKPVKPRVLLAHIRALLRRSANGTSIRKFKSPGQQIFERPPIENCTEHLEIGELIINTSCRSVLLNDEPLDITSREFDILWILANHAGEVVSRDFLHQYIRGIEYNGLDRTVDQHISKIRKKLGDISQPAPTIKSIRGIGYVFTVGPDLI